MKSSLYRSFGLILLGAMLGLLASGTLSQAQEKVEYRKADKKADITGAIVEESPGIVKVKPGIGADSIIPVASIIRVTYTAPNFAIKAEIDGAAQLAEKKKFAEAVDLYTAVLPKLDAKSGGLKRDIEYRIAMIKVDATEGIAARSADATDSLEKFLKAHPSSWQYSQIARALARLQSDSGRTPDAQKTLEALSAALPKESRGDVDTMLVDLLLRTGNLEVAKAKIDASIAILPPSDSNRERMRICQIGLKVLDASAKMEDLSKELVGEAEKAPPAIKAAAYLTLGDAFVFRKQNREAMWNYLMVDAVFNTNPADQLRAMERLEVLFRDVDPIKDEARAKVYRDRIGRMR